jgi:hypothetical protein
MFDQQILNKIVGIFSLNSIGQNNQTNIFVLACGTDVFGILTFWPSTVSYFWFRENIPEENQMLYRTFSWMRLRHSQHGRKRLRLSFENFLTNY